jgi:hypothetical protein
MNEKSCNALMELIGEAKLNEVTDLFLKKHIFSQKTSFQSSVVQELILDKL